MAESTAGVATDVDALKDATVRTVAELNDDIADVLEATEDLYFDYVVGDVTDHREINGHVHFEIDYDDASIHCIAFAYQRSAATDDLEEGTQVAIAGDLSYYEARGSCSILVSDVVELGDGTYEQTYRENKRTLEEGGLLDDEHKQALPPHPKTVGIVTSADSDAREDAVTSIRDRHPDVDIVIHHATVQGEQALPTILEAISELDRDPEVDVIVVTRGGGADTTLRVFNEVALCRVIFGTDTPIVVGIGHERDRTLADEVADRRVMTPTHVGSIVPEKATLNDELVDLYESLESAYADHARSVLSETVSSLDRALETLARKRLTEFESRLDHAIEAIELETEHEREAEAIEETYARRQRFQRIAIVVLLTLLVALGAYVLFTL